MEPRRRLHAFYLVQRLRSKESPGTATGFDRFFGLEYMGSSEFEWGAVPESLKSIRAAGELVIDKREILRPNNMIRDVYFVGPQAGIDEKIDDFQTWVADERPRCKEASYFPENFEECTRDSQAETVAWWALNENIGWTLDVGQAEKLLLAFGPKS